MVADELITEFSVQSKDYKFINIASLEEMPEDLSDSIIAVTEDKFAEHLKTKVVSLMPKKGVITGALPQHLEGMPAARFKKALKSGDYDYYINLDCDITAEGTTYIDFGVSTKRSKVKPKIRLSAVIYDPEKNKVWSNKVVLDDFAKLRQVRKENVKGWRDKHTYDVKESETLTAEDVFSMYFLAIIKLFE